MIEFAAIGLAFLCQRLGALDPSLTPKPQERSEADKLEAARKMAIHDAEWRQLGRKLGVYK